MNERFEDRLWRLLEECDKEGIDMRDEDFITVINDFRAAKEHELSEYDQMALQIWDRAALAWINGTHNGRKGKFYTEMQLNDICDFIVESVNYAFAHDNLKGPIGKHAEKPAQEAKKTITIKMRPLGEEVISQSRVADKDEVEDLKQFIAKALKDFGM